MESDGDSLFAIDPTFTCEKCQGHLVYRGSKTCFPCQNGGSQLTDLIKTYKGAKVKKVQASQIEIMQFQKKASGNLPPLK